MKRIHSPSGRQAAAVAPAFRSSAVARMAQMPVATLRVWEQRYQAVKPATARSGHRRYSPEDVQRVLLLRQLTEQGHGIGSIARLDTPQLQELAEPAAPRSGTRARAGAAPSSPVRLLVVGSAWAARLQHAIPPSLAQAVRVVAQFESLEDLARQGPAPRADVLVWHAPVLRGGMPRALAAARDATRVRQVAVVYRFAARDARRALADAGMTALREPAGDEALGAWLASLGALDAAPSRSRATRSPARRPLDKGIAPRRFDDAALTAMAGLSSTLACECPHHVAELLMQLSSFEAYSARCADADPADAELHAYLRHVAASSRALFESALERVALHEGVRLR